MSDDDVGGGGGASRSTEPASGTSAATDVSLREHLAALRQADLRFLEERDRRYTEVGVERKKALRIKEEEAGKALNLAREIQSYKDEKANELREQINSERGLYASKEDVAQAVDKVEATIKPLNDFMATEQGRTTGISASVAVIYAVIVLAISVVGAYIIGHRAQVVAPVAPTVTCTSTYHPAPCP